MANTLLHLCIEFLLIGTFSFGGGMATIPLLSNLADKYSWFTHKELTDMIALSEITPGPIGVNMATYVGIKTAGFIGGIVSVLSLTAPAIIVMFLMYKFVLQKKDTPLIQKAFYGIKPIVVAMFLAGLWSVIKVTLISFDGGFHFNIFEIVLFIVVLILSNVFKNVHPTLFIVLGGLIGLCKYLIFK